MQFDGERERETSEGAVRLLVYVWFIGSALVVEDDGRVLSERD